MMDKINQFADYLTGRGTLASASVLVALYCLLGIYNKNMEMKK